MKVLGQILKLLITAVFLFLPNLYFGDIFYYSLTTSKTFFIYGVITLIFTLWLNLVIWFGSYRPNKKIFLYFSPIFSLIIWLIITSLLNQNFSLAFWSSLSRGTGILSLIMGTIFAFVITSVILSEKEKFIKQILFSTAGGLFILNLSIIFKLGSVGGGLIGNSVLAGTYISFVLGLIFWLKSFGLNLKEKIILLGVLLSTILNPIIFQLESRATILTLIISFLLACLCYLLARKRLILIGLAVIFLLFTILSPYIIRNNITSIDSEHKLLTSRPIFWSVAEQAIQDKPLFGWGVEGYSKAYNALMSVDLWSGYKTVELWVDRAHNQIYEIGVSGGLPAIVLYLIIISILFLSFYRLYKQNKISKYSLGVLVFILSGYLIQGIFSFDSLASLILFLAFYGIVSGLLIERKNESVFIRKYQIILAILTALFLVGSLYYLTFLPYKKVYKLASVTTLSLDKRFNHYKDLNNISSVGDYKEMGRLSEEYYQLYSSNFNKIVSNDKLLNFSKQDLDGIISYFDNLVFRGVEDDQLAYFLIKLKNIRASLP